jgi:hypothetical protein
VKLLLVVILFSLSAHAQSVLEDFKSRPLPIQWQKNLIQKSHSKKMFSSPVDAAVSSGLETRAQYLASSLQQQFAIVLKPLLTPVACTNAPEFLDYLNALRVSGDYRNCFDLAEACRSSGTLTDISLEHAVMIQSARCATGNFDLATAHSIFINALDAKYAKAKDFQLGVMLAADFAIKTEYAPEVASIISSNTDWDAKTQGLAAALIELWFLGKTSAATATDIESFTQALLISSDMGLRSFIHERTIRHLDRNLYDEKASLLELEKSLPELNDPSQWAQDAYEDLYFQSNSPNDFKLAQIVL